MKTFALRIFVALSSIHRIKAFLWHDIRAKRRGHGVHSPFVYALAKQVIPWKKPGSELAPADDWRKTCRYNPAEINVTDLGTGTSGPRRISAIARRSAKSRDAALLLSRLVAHFQPAYMLELGTSLGISTLYQAIRPEGVAHPKKFVTIEGCPETAKVAENTLFRYSRVVEVVTGNFDEVLPAVLKNFPQLDYVYFDGNHRLEPTLRYFELCLPLAHNDSIFIFDDIHWSEEMEEAWKRICADQRVSVSIDLFDFGLVFFRREQVKEHFVLG